MSILFHREKEAALEEFFAKKLGNHLLFFFPFSFLLLTRFVFGIELQPAGKGEGFIDYNVPRPKLQALPEFFKELEEREEELGITDIQLSMTSLEEVFLSISGLYEFDE
jgi:hypothetical protein